VVLPSLSSTDLSSSARPATEPASSATSMRWITLPSSSRGARCDSRLRQGRGSAHRSRHPVYCHSQWR
jgi:hypothetical protein